MKNSPISILIADDDSYCRIGIKHTLTKFGPITEAESAAQVSELIKKQHFDLAIIDMQMEQEDSGLKVLAQTNDKNIPTIILSSHDDDELTEKSYDLGCLHFLNKLHYRSHLDHYISNFVKKKKRNYLQEIIQSHYITQDEDTIATLRMLFDMNLQDKNILITGETGVGKSQIGKIIHQMGHQEDRSFVHLNCSEIAETLMESELFGHVKGSFTGAASDKKGKLELANGGTLFLDEIATMPMSMQQKLLKALDEKVFYPVGSSKPIKINFTLISATCEDLLEKISKGEFRKDLFYRISGINFEIKPLRKRTNDIHLLLKYFMQNLPRKIVLKKEVVQHFLNYSWPGNIRELKKTIDYLSSLNVGIITLENLPKGNLANSSKDNHLLSHEQMQYIQEHGFRKLIEQLEQEAVKQVMLKHSGKITRAVKEMQISNSAFYRILQHNQFGM